MTIEKLFEELREMLDFHFRNASNKQDLIERITEELDRMEEEYKKQD